MCNVDIMEAVQQGVDNILFKAWKHTGHIDRFNGEEVVFTVDGEQYVLHLDKYRGG